MAYKDGRKIGCRVLFYIPALLKLCSLFDDTYVRNDRWSGLYFLAVLNKLSPGNSDMVFRLRLFF